MSERMPACSRLQRRRMRGKRHYSPECTRHHHRPDVTAAASRRTPPATRPAPQRHSLAHVRVCMCALRSGV